MKIFLFLFALATTGNLIAQQIDSTTWAYAELLGTKKPFSSKVVVEIDYGQSSNIFQNDAIVDENGKAISFNSMVDAMNYMGKLGWQFVQAIVITEGSQSVYHWIMRREVSIDDKGNYIPMTRKDFKKGKN